VLGENRHKPLKRESGLPSLTTAGYVMPRAVQSGATPSLRSIRRRLSLAERVRFELTRAVKPCRFSSPITPNTRATVVSHKLLIVRHSYAVFAASQGWFFRPFSTRSRVRCYSGVTRTAVRSRRAADLG